MDQGKGSDNPNNDDFVSESQLESNTAADKLITGMKRDKERREEIDYHSHSDNISDIIDEATSNSSISTGLFDATLKRYPGYVLGGFIGLAVASELGDFSLTEWFIVIICFAIAGNLLVRLIQGIGARRGIEVPSASLTNYPGAAIGGLAGFIASRLIGNAVIGPLVLMVCGAIVGEIMYRLFKYAVPD